MSTVYSVTHFVNIYLEKKLEEHYLHVNSTFFCMVELQVSFLLLYVFSTNEHQLPLR